MHRADYGSYKSRLAAYGRFQIRDVVEEKLGEQGSSMGDLIVELLGLPFPPPAGGLPRCSLACCIAVTTPTLRLIRDALPHGLEKV